MELIPLLERRARVIAIALVVLASARIVATYGVFSHTFDEPVHVACGMEWLSLGRYQYETQHPPLARVAAAMGPYLTGIRSQGTPLGTEISMYTEGNAILSARSNVATARSGSPRARYARAAVPSAHCSSG